MRLGSINTAVESLVPEVVAQLVGIYPDLKFHIKPALSSELFNEVQSGEIDAAVCLHPMFALPKTLMWRQLREEKLIALAPLELAGRDPHELLRTMPFIRFDRKQWGGQQVDNYLRITNIAPGAHRVEPSDRNCHARRARRRGCAGSDTVMPTTITARIVRLQLPVATRPRQLGILWQRSSIHGKLINLFVNQATILCQSSDID